jgi:gamma-glutamylcyclotransferase (GGCT)/AIG2-like uncharacterized protein YtfP
LRKDFGLDIVSELEHIGRGRIEGKMVDLGEYPGAIAGTGEITGDLYRLDDPEKMLAALDEYEGSEFVRRIAKVRMEDRVVEAWTYWYQGDPIDHPAIADNDYLNYLKSIKPK